MLFLCWYSVIHLRQASRIHLDEAYTSYSVGHSHPIEPLGKKCKKRRGESVTVNPESTLFPEAGWDDDMEALGCVLDRVARNEVKQTVMYTMQ